MNVTSFKIIEGYLKEHVSLIVGGLNIEGAVI